MTAVPPAPANATPATHRAPRRWSLTLLHLLVALASGVATVTFAFSFYGIRDFAEQAMKVPHWMSWAAPVGVDILSLCGWLSATLLHTAPLRVRLYPWTVFVIAASASVGANIVHAETRQLSLAGAIGAAVSPLFFALASHLVVVTRRWAARLSQPVADSVATEPVVVSPVVVAETVAPPEPVAVVDGVAEAPVSPAPVSQPTLVAVPSPVATVSPVVARVSAKRRDKAPRPDLVAVARQRVMGGESAADVAAALGKSLRTVQRWTQDLRVAEPAAG